MCHRTHGEPHSSVPLLRLRAPASCNVCPRSCAQTSSFPLHFCPRDSRPIFSMPFRLELGSTIPSSSVTKRRTYRAISRRLLQKSFFTMTLCVPRFPISVLGRESCAPRRLCGQTANPHSRLDTSFINSHFASFEQTA
jgi:hypothetical protein